VPTTENDRRNQQAPVLQNPSLPDHDRRRDPGMHSVCLEPEQFDPLGPSAPDESDRAAPDAEFGEILHSGTKSNQGKIPVDPNNLLTSDSDASVEQDPEDRGESLPDIMDGDQH